MPTVSRRSLLAVLAVLLLLCTSQAVYASTAAIDSVLPDVSLSVLPDSSSMPMTTVPDSSSMLDTPLTTTPDTTASSPDDGGFAYTGLVIALVVAGLVIALIILLVPKNKDKA